MRRRKFLIGAGSFAAATAGAIGTGAFTSVDANRQIDVDLEDDSDAFLAIEPEENSPNADEYVDDSGNTVSIDITNTNAGGLGLNDNATTVIDDILQIVNQGTQGVFVGYTHPASPAPGNFALYHEDPDYDGDETQYDPSNGNYNNGGQLNINTAQDENGDGEPDLVKIGPGETLDNIGIFFFDSPDISAITSDPVTFQAAATFDDL